MNARLTQVLAALSATGFAMAHDPGLSSVRIRRAPTAVVVQAAFANADFCAATDFDRDHDGRLDADELAAAANVPAMRQLGVRVAVAGVALPLFACQVALAANRDVEIELSFAVDGGDAAQQFDLQLDLLQHMARGHRCYTAVVDADGAVLRDALLSATACGFVVPAATTASLTAAATGFDQGARFFGLGIEHILTGFDHLAFLLALLVAGVTLRRVLATITAFTVAHSLTLGAAALGLVHLPSALVESTIAASIVWVALANLLQRGERAPHRWPLALVFGLVHGFGFASVLRDLHVGGSGATVPLVTFNLGVEVGQLAFAAVVVPLLALAARSAHGRAVPTVLSVIVGMLGLVWFCQRAFG